MKPKQVKPKDLLGVLLKHGFTIKRQKGSHVFIERGGRCTSISIHNKPLPKGTLHTILKQVGVEEVELEL